MRACSRSRASCCACRIPTALRMQCGRTPSLLVPERPRLLPVANAVRDVFFYAFSLRSVGSLMLSFDGSWRGAYWRAYDFFVRFVDSLWCVPCSCYPFTRRIALSLLFPPPPCFPQAAYNCPHGQKYPAFRTFPPAMTFLETVCTEI